MFSSAVDMDAALVAIVQVPYRDLIILEYNSLFANCCTTRSTSHFSASKNYFQISRSVVSRLSWNWCQTCTLKLLVHSAALEYVCSKECISFWLYSSKQSKCFSFDIWPHEIFSFLYCLFAPFWVARKRRITCIDRRHCSSHQSTRHGWSRDRVMDSALDICGRFQSLLPLWWDKGTDVLFWEKCVKCPTLYNIISIKTVPKTVLHVPIIPQYTKKEKSRIWLCDPIL